MKLAPGLALRALLFLCLFTRMSLAGTLTGTTVDSGGKAVSSVRIIVLDTLTRKRISIVSSAQGTFSIELPRGIYAVYADSGQFESALAHLRMEPHDQRQLEIRVTARGLVAREIRIAEPETARDHLPAAEEDLSLETIRDYQVMTEATPARVKSESLAEIINPFPARRGGNLHGSLYEFHRNDNFDARNFFDPVGKTLPEYKRNQFGLSMSAALGRSLSVLGSYDGLRIIQGSTLLSHVPTAAMKQGDLSELSIPLRDPWSAAPLEGNRIPASSLHPVSLRLLHLLPDPNRPDPDRNFVNNKPVIRNRDSYSFRVDRQLNADSKIHVRYDIQDGHHALAHPLPTLGSIREERDQEVAVSYTHKITNRLLASGRFEVNRNVDFLSSVNAGRTGLLDSVGIQGVRVFDPLDEGYPDFRLSGYASFGDAQFPITAASTRISWDGSMTYTSANHTIRLGSGFLAHQSNNNRSDGIRKGRFSFSGYYTGDSFADFLYGLPDLASRGVGSDRVDLRRRSWYVFARDQWKINPRWTISSGLNYNYYRPYRSVHNTISGFYPLVLEPPLTGEFVTVDSERARQLGLDRAGRGGLVFPDRNDWAPSLGIAYSPLGNNRFVLRSGYSLSYSPLGSGYFVNYLGRNYPFYYVETALSPIDRPQISLTHPFEAAVATELGVRGIEPNLRTSYVQSWHLSIQNEIFQRWILNTSYEGKKGTHLPRLVAGNAPHAGPGSVQPRRPNPRYGRFSIITGSGSSVSHALELQAERRLGGGVSLKSGLTWISAINDAYRSYPANPRNLRAERGRADFIPGRQVFLNYIVDLPFGKGGKFMKDSTGWLQGVVSGWRISGITHLQDGSPFSAVSRGDPNNDGVSDDRPDRIGPGHVKGSQRTIDGWFDINDFSMPPLYAFGNSGRNILEGPPYQNWDMSIIKQTRFSDGNLIELRVELFNAFNKVNFEQPNAVIGTSVFGKIFGARRAREIEIALRYSF